MDLPNYFIDNIQRVFGEAGETWLGKLPDIVAGCADRWQLTLLDPIPNLSLNYMAYVVTSAGEDAVLKIGVLPHEVQGEITALQLYNGRGIVRCLDADLALGAFVLERLNPGQMLTSLGDNARETLAAAGIMKTLPVPCPADQGLPTFAGWLDKAFARLRHTYGPDCEPLGRRLVEHAEAAFRAIEADKQADMLLHGDLHHFNILYDDHRGWLAIDPQGAIGDADLEVGRFVHNFIPYDLTSAEKQRLIEERLDILAGELGARREKLLLCTLIDHVLSLSWSLEDSYITDDWYNELEVARMLNEMADK
ncbi:MAG: aminoglycoside phosphotransferase family protein [Armatimonadota bacterium]